MSAAKKPSARSSSSASVSKGADAIALLTADHKEVRQLFKDYEKLAASDAEADTKQELASTICEMLAVHAQIEEEIFYPAAREVLQGDGDLVAEATVEHASAKDLIAQIQQSSPDDELYDAKVKVLGEYVNHHVEEEEGEMFPKIKKAKLDVKEIGAQLSARKEELLPEANEEEA